MKWVGKGIGAFIGGIVGGPLGAVGGAIIGNFFDQTRNDREERTDPSETYYEHDNEYIEGGNIKELQEYLYGVFNNLSRSFVDRNLFFLMICLITYNFFMIYYEKIPVKIIKEHLTHLYNSEDLGDSMLSEGTMKKIIDKCLSTNVDQNFRDQVLQLINLSKADNFLPVIFIFIMNIATVHEAYYTTRIKNNLLEYMSLYDADEETYHEIKKDANVLAIRFQIYLAGIFTKICMSDGEFSSSELRTIENFLISEMEYDEFEIHRFFIICESVKNNKYSIDQYGRSFYSIVREMMGSKDKTDSLLYKLLAFIYQMMLNEGDCPKCSIDAFEKLIGCFHIDKERFYSSYKDNDYDYDYDNGYDEPISRGDLKQYYEILGIKEGASVVEIKNAYRMNVKKFHPDNLSSKDLPDEFIDFAKTKMQQINNAYEILMRHAK